MDQAKYRGDWVVSMVLCVYARDKMRVHKLVHSDPSVQYTEGLCVFKGQLVSVGLESEHRL